MANTTLDRAEVAADGAWVSVLWRDGFTARFHAVWLRDNALDPDTRDPGNGQRLISVLDIPAHTTLSHAYVNDNNALCVGFSPERKSGVFPGDWLRQHHYDKPAPTDAAWLASAITCWDNTLGQALPTVSFPVAQSDPQVLKTWLAAIRRYGFATMSDLPTDSGALLRVVDLFGYVRETNYGRWFEVRSHVNPSNLAFTGLALQAHTDNPYRDPVPTLQLLACLENAVEGGDSIVVDGFNAVKTLQQECAESFDLLSRYCAQFEFRGEQGVCLQAYKPMIELSVDSELIAVRFNNRSAAPFARIPFDKMAAYYAAYQTFAEIINRESMAIHFTLSPGDLFIVDNTRVMHARTGFSGGGSRWLQGCYADKDSLYSTLTVLEQTQ